MAAASRVFSLALIASARSIHATGPDFLVPYVYDVDLTMEYNNDLFSGIADTYLGGNLKSSDTHNSTTRYEFVSLPKLGTLGWNNSLAGVFIYSPIRVTRLDRTDNFTYRAVNEYGESNWAVVTIEFLHDNESDGMLKALVAIALISTLMSIGGLIRAVILQLLLNPDRRFQGAIWQSLAFLAHPPVDPFVSAKSASDFKVKLEETDSEEEGQEETTANPVGGDVKVVEDTDEFT